MSFREPAFYISKGAFGRFNGVILDGATQFEGVTIQGNTPEINRTVLTSPRQEYTGGIPDSGAISTTLLAAPHTPIYHELEDSNDGSKVRNLEIFVGAIPTDGRETDGSALEVIQDITRTEVDTASFTPAYPANSVALRESYLRELAQGFAVGDFFRITTSAGVVTDLRISDIHYLPRAKSSVNYIGITFNSGNRPASDGSGSAYAQFATTLFSTTGNTIAIVRPAFKYNIPVYAMNIGQGFGTGGLISKQITFRITSKGTRTVGSDGVKNNEYRASSPALAHTGVARHFTTLS